MRSFILFLTFLLLLSPSRALINSNFLRSNTSVSGGCRAFQGRCCRNTPCTLTYALEARWATLVDERCPGRCDRCTVLCAAHVSECNTRCRSLVRLTAAQQGRNCKCTRDVATTKGLRERCQISCERAKGRCLRGCEKAICPLVARMKVQFRAGVQGKCGTVCPPTDFLPNPAACPAVPTLSRQAAV